jgi:predicted O-methyltransferase YrrM
MLLKSTEGLGKGAKRRWKIIRLFIPSKTRWFFEGHPQLEGQLWFKERKLIYDTIREYKPSHCFEIGTWKGGGSTLFIAQALYENKQGKLHTIEINKNFYDAVRNNYQTYLEHLTPYIEFYLGDYRDKFSEVLNAIGKLDFLFLDGPENAQETLGQYEFFAPYMQKGCVVMVHDWLTEKSRIVKPLIQGVDDWTIKTVLTPPQSPGFALAIKNKGTDWL